MRDVAERLRVSMATVYKLVEQGALPGGAQNALPRRVTPAKLHLSAMDLTARLGALMQLPRCPAVRYYGCFAPNARARPQVVKAGAQAPCRRNKPRDKDSGGADGAVPERPRRRAGAHRALRGPRGRTSHFYSVVAAAPP
ncbi:MAG: hypothetical protein ACOYOB_20380 [Myxococcota bacterium]